MNPQPRIIGLAGTNGSGKDTAGYILADDFKYLFISVTDILRDELQRRGQAITRANLRILSADWRRQAGLGVLVDKAVAEYQLVPAGYQGLVIASLRNPGEADRVHQMGGIVIWVDADPKIRYARIRSNFVLRDRADEDDKTFEQFVAEEAAEMTRPAGGDEATLSLSAVKERCDFKINNDKDQATLKAALATAIGLKS